MSFRLKRSHLAFALSSVATNNRECATVVACRNSSSKFPSNPGGLIPTFQHRPHLPPPSQRPRRNFSSNPLQYSALDLLEERDAPPVLTSTKSQTIKRYRSLSRAKHRAEHDVTLLEGHRLIIDTLANPIVRGLYHDVLVTREALQHHKLGRPLSDRLVDLIEDGTCAVHLATDAVVRAACDTVNPQVRIKGLFFFVLSLQQTNDSMYATYYYLFTFLYL